MATPKTKRRRNQIARHPERVAIEMARLGGVTLDRIAERFHVHRDSIWRHMEGLSPEYKRALIADVPREEVARRAAEESGNLLDHFKMVRNLAERQLIEAKACSDGLAVAKLARAAIDANDAVGRLTGEIERNSRSSTINVNNVLNIMDQPGFRDLEHGLLDIATRHPPAKPDIIALVRRLQSPPLMIEGERAVA